MDVSSTMSPNVTGQRSVQMRALTGHITIDLSEAASEQQLHWQSVQDGAPRVDLDESSPAKDVGHAE